MVRAASKNHESVTVIVDPADYAHVLARTRRQRRRHQHRHALEPRRQGVRAHREVRHHGVELPAAAVKATTRRSFPAHAAAGVRKDPGPALRREPAPAAPRSIASLGASGSCVANAHACSRARSCRSTTSPTPTPRSNACACSTSPPASSSSTPIPAAWPRRCRWPMPTTAPIAPTRPRRSAASSPSIASSTRKRPRPSRAASSSKSSPRRRSRRPPPPCSRASRTSACSVIGALANRPRIRARIPQRGRRPAGAEPRHRARAARHLQDRHAEEARRPRSTRTCGSPGACAST